MAGFSAAFGPGFAVAAVVPPPPPRHIRRQLRDALRALLLGATAAGDRVHVNRRKALAAAATPAVVITTPGEEVEILTMDADPLQTRTVNVLIECCVAGDDIDDAADELGLEVERVMHGAENLGGLLTVPLQLLRTRTDAEELTSPPVGVLQLAYLAEITTAASSPDEAL